LVYERCLAIPNIQNTAEQEALEQLFLPIGPEGLQGDVLGNKHHISAGLMSDDESDPEKPQIFRDFIIKYILLSRYKVASDLRVHCPGNIAGTRTPSSNPFHTASLPPCSSNTTVVGAKKGLPMNFYDERWLNSLVNRDRQQH
jgi:hypothetical protein